MVGAPFLTRTSLAVHELPIVIQSALGDLCPRDLPKENTRTHSHTCVFVCVCISFFVAEVKGLGGHGERQRGPGTLNPIFPLLEEQMFELCFLGQQLIVIQMHISIRSDM